MFCYASYFLLYSSFAVNEDPERIYKSIIRFICRKWHRGKFGHKKTAVTTRRHQCRRHAYNSDY